MKTTSRFAIAAAAGVLLGGIALSPAKAADLGGDCCADLEERVAELEATTARKGNRVVSLTISGQVDTVIFWWDDGIEDDVYIVGNSQSSSRFRFSGSAKIDADVSAGYVLEWEVFAGGKSSSVNQFDDDAGSTSLAFRHEYFWIKSQRLGQISLGHQSTAIDGIHSINLGSTGPADQTNVFEFTQGFFLRTGDGGFVGDTTWGDLMFSIDGPRANVIRYDSPTFAGFIASASWGEDDYWDVALRYAGEWNSIRVAAGIGYAEDSENPDNLTCGGGDGRTEGDEEFAFGEFIGPKTECDLLSGSASILHVPSGLFASVGASRLNVDTEGVEGEGNWFGTIFGIQGKWTSLGTTALYGVWSEFEVDADDNDGDSEVDGWGLGLNQQLDAAAMDLYVGYRHYEVDDLGGDSTNDLEDMDQVYAGGRIKF